MATRSSSQSLVMSNTVIGLAMATAIAFGTTYYYWLLIKPRWATLTTRKGKTLTSVESIKAVTDPTFRGLLRRSLYRPFITSIQVSGPLPLPSPSLTLWLGPLTSLIDVKLSGLGLEEFPPTVADLPFLQRLNLSKNKLKRYVALQDLDVSSNELESVPPEIGNLRSLKYLNLMANQLTAVPPEIGQLRVLYRLGLKSNKIKSLPSSVGGMEGLVELFLTGNLLESLPSELGRLLNLFKLQASFNRLSSLPPSMASLPRLELFRVAVNAISKVPPQFASLDSLAWFSLAGNPVCPPARPPHGAIEHIEAQEVEVGEKLGDGASGEVFLATWRGRQVAFKRFKAETSPDGRCADEVAVTCAVLHPNLIKVVATVGHPRGLPQGLLMEVAPGRAMADKPNFASLLRCRWPPKLEFSVHHALRVGSCVARALKYLHRMGICHGDVYAHNVVADENGDAVLCDYGAAFFYAKDTVPYEAHEVRAYGLFLTDLVNRLTKTSPGVEDMAAEALKALAASCTEVEAENRQSFTDVLRVLESVTEDMK